MTLEAQHTAAVSSRITAIIGERVSIGNGLELGHHCVIGSDVCIGNRVTLGHGSIIGDGVVIGDDTIIGCHVVLHAETRIEAHVIIMDHAVLGKHPYRAKRSIMKNEAKLEPCWIHMNSVIGTGAIVYAGAELQQDVFVADLATIRERAYIGAATIIGRGAAIENDCTVGQRCKLETNCYITAYSTVGDDVFVAPGVLTSNDNYMGRTKARLNKMRGITIERGGRIGVGAVTLPGVTIKEEGVVGAGSIVTRDIDRGAVFVGSPARYVRAVPQEQLLQMQE